MRNTNSIVLGQRVQTIKHKHSGVVCSIFKNWQNLKSETQFLTIDPDDESNKMDTVEKLINGDPKDEWLNFQNIPIKESNLEERWFTILCDTGGSIWTYESDLIVCSEKPKTAIQWLAEKMGHPIIFNSFIEEALRIEKNQIIDCVSSIYSGLMDSKKENFINLGEQYFNETYGK